jgi:hypothetical protein
MLGRSWIGCTIVLGPGRCDERTGWELCRSLCGSEAGGKDMDTHEQVGNTYVHGTTDEEAWEKKGKVH